MITKTNLRFYLYFKNQHMVHLWQMVYLNSYISITLLLEHRMLCLLNLHFVLNGLWSASEIGFVLESRQTSKESKRTYSLIKLIKMRFCLMSVVIVMNRALRWYKWDLKQFIPIWLSTKLMIIYVLHVQFVSDLIPMQKNFWLFW